MSKDLRKSSRSIFDISPRKQPVISYPSKYAALRHGTCQHVFASPKPVLQDLRSENCAVPWCAIAKTIHDGHNPFGSLNSLRLSHIARPPAQAFIDFIGSLGCIQDITRTLSMPDGMDAVDFASSKPAHLQHLATVMVRD